MGALPSSSRQLLAAICAWCGALGLPATALAAIELVSQARSVDAAWSATIEVDPPDHPYAPDLEGPHASSEDASAADFGSFAAEVSAPGPSDGLASQFGPITPWGSFSVASQESEISQSGVVTIQAEGEEAAGPYYFYGCHFFFPEVCIFSWDIGSSGASLFSITFEVDEPTLYHLSGSAELYAFQAGADAEVILREEGGEILFETGAFDCSYPPFQYFCDPINFSMTDVLAPGTYAVSALASGSGSLFDTPVGPVEGMSAASYFLTLELIPPSAQLPALGVASRLLLAMLLPLLAVKVVRCRSAGRRPRP